MHRRRHGAARQCPVRRACRPRRRAARSAGRGRGRRRRGGPPEPHRARDHPVRGLAPRRSRDPRQPRPDAGGDAVPARRRGGKGRDRGRTRPRRHRCRARPARGGVIATRRAGRRRPGRARAADLHQRHHRQAEGRDARPLEHRRDVRHDARRSRYHGRRSQPADPAVVPRQRHRRRHPDPAAGRWPRDRRRAVQPEDVLRPRRADPADVLLGGAGDLRDADLDAGGRDGRHDVAAARSLRRGADARGADQPRRGHARGRARRGLRAVRGLVRLDAQPLRRRAQARHGRPPAPRPGGPGRRRTRAIRSLRASGARW